MNDVNWWLMALAFLLGLLLTFAFMIRRVKREVPVYAALGRGPGVGFKGPDVDVKKPDIGVKAPDVYLKGAGLAAGAAAVGGAAAAKFVGGKDDEEPYGSGSLRLARGAVVPSGYTIKGNEDSMLYHSPDSPFYKETDAEVWFRDKESAERAGFTRWDKGRSGGGAAKFADIPPGPYGVGSAKPGAGGSGPEGWTIKGNEDSMLYHTPESPSYEQAIAEVWFGDEGTAEAAGFKKYK
jgi:hypothetical protein